MRESSGYEEQHSRIFSRNILTDCVHEHVAKKLGLRFVDMADGGTNVMWLMVVRTGTTDDDN